MSVLQNYMILFNCVYKYVCVCEYVCPCICGCVCDQTCHWEAHLWAPITIVAHPLLYESQIIGEILAKFLTVRL